MTTATKTKTTREYDKHSPEAEISPQSWPWQSEQVLRYWGYVLPRLTGEYEIDKTGKKLKHIEIGEHWTPRKVMALRIWLMNNERIIYRYLTPSGHSSFYAGIRAQRTAAGKTNPGKYTKAAAESIDMEAENWRRSLKIHPGASRDAVLACLTRPSGSWEILDLIMRGLLDPPDAHITPPIILDTIKGTLQWK